VPKNVHTIANNFNTIFPFLKCVYIFLASSVHTYFMREIVFSIFIFFYLFKIDISLT